MVEDHAKYKPTVARRRKYPGGYGDYEGNPDLEFLTYEVPIKGKPANGRCGARIRKRHLGEDHYEMCRNWAIKPGGRCGRHGGLSTGPRTEEGLRRLRQGFRRWADERAERARAEAEEKGQKPDNPGEPER